MEHQLSLANQEDWLRAVDAVGPASMLVVIRFHLGKDVRQLYTAEDVWQETLLRAWQSRQSIHWQGVEAFKRLLITIAKHTIGDLRDHLQAKKRDANHGAPWALRLRRESQERGPADEEPWTTSTPSRIASAREDSDVMQRALASLPEDVRDVVRLRLFECQTMEEIADALQLGVGAVRHRFRQGSEIYRARLKGLRDTTNGAPPRPQ